MAIRHAKDLVPSLRGRMRRKGIEEPEEVSAQRGTTNPSPFAGMQRGAKPPPPAE